MLRRTALAATAMLAAGALLLTACTGGSSPDPTTTPEADPDASAIIRLVLEPGNLDIRETAGAALDQILVDNIYQGLVSRTPEQDIVPALAEDWEVSEDGLTYTFKLRTGVKFHSGKTFSSADVKYTFERWLKNEKSPTRYTIQPITSVEAPDPQTVVLKLDKPYNILLDQVAGSWAVILNGEAVDKAGANYGVTTVDGTGPYKFKEWVR